MIVFLFIVTKVNIFILDNQVTTTVVNISGLIIAIIIALLSKRQDQ